LIFIGDDFQLPSVEVGNFLHDSINSGVFKITKLTKVFRQKDGGILDTATKIRLGEQYVDSNFDGVQEFGKDMTLHCCDPAHTADGAIYYYKKALKNGYSPEDIVVLSPTKKGPKGTRYLNGKIQEIVNPKVSGKNELAHGMDTVFREGDMVLNTQNNYEALNIFDEQVTIVNGEHGVIKKIDLEKKQAIIDYGDEAGEVITPFSSLDAVIHSYAMTIHKVQGSGFKIVILLIDHSHQFQLNANLIYTGKTRAKEHLYVIGQANIINRSAKKNVSMERNSFLKEFLKSA
jgi:exodeoxyribonuclease V alpha subunit